MFEGALFNCPAAWEPLLPLGVTALRQREPLLARQWDLVCLTRSGCERLAGERLRCRLLLVPGDCPAALLAMAETVITWGLSPRDSLTLSSLRSPVLCVQRALPRTDGGMVEPQEVPLSIPPGAAEALLPLLGVRLLQMPLAAAAELCYPVGIKPEEDVTG